MEEKFSEVIASNGVKMSASRLRTQSKEEEKIDPNVMIQRSIKTELMYMKNNVNLHKICITGGPCAGKTTALAML